MPGPMLQNWHQQYKYMGSSDDTFIECCSLSVQCSSTLPRYAFRGALHIQPCNHKVGMVAPAGWESCFHAQHPRRDRHHHLGQHCATQAALTMTAACP